MPQYAAPFLQGDPVTFILDVYKRQDYGFAGGVFAYGGPTWIRNSKMTTDGEKDFEKRIQEYREPRPKDPPFMANEEESEELTLSLIHI